MPLDPEIATLLDRVRRADRPPFQSMSPAPVRLDDRKASRVFEIAPQVLPRVTEHAFRTRDQADALGVDRARLAIGGDSAGGTLAAVTAIRARDEGIACVLQLLLYPGTKRDDDTPSRRAVTEGYLLDATTIARFFDQYVPHRADRDAHRDLADVLRSAFAGPATSSPLNDRILEKTS